jgi:hypothetical protein
VLKKINLGGISYRFFLVFIGKTFTMKKRHIVSKLASIISEGTKGVTKKVVLENEKSTLQKEFLMIENEVSSPEMMSVLNGYIEAAIWTAEEELDSEDDVESYISNDSRIDAYVDVRNFINTAGSLIDDIDHSQVGHDFWLTRNGHGAGFWDRGLGEVGEKLSKIASDMGEKNVYWGDDGKIYID